MHQGGGVALASWRQFDTDGVALTPVDMIAVGKYLCHGRQATVRPRVNAEAGQPIAISADR